MDCPLRNPGTDARVQNNCVQFGAPAFYLCTHEVGHLSSLSLRLNTFTFKCASMGDLTEDCAIHLKNTNISMGVSHGLSPCWKWVCTDPLSWEQKERPPGVASLCYPGDGEDCGLVRDKLFLRCCLIDSHVIFFSMLLNQSYIFFNLEATLQYCIGFAILNLERLGGWDKSFGLPNLVCTANKGVSDVSRLCL